MRRVTSLPFCDFFLLRGFICLPLLLIVQETFSRQSDTAFIRASINYAREFSINKLKNEWPLNTGGQYQEYISLEGEHPYFTSSWSLGSVQYLNDQYKNILMLLDLQRDKLIIQHTVFNTKIELSNEKVKWFSFSSHQFVNLLKDTIKDLPESGYYELLQRGKVSLVVRWNKNIKRSMLSGKETAILKETIRYYVLKEGAAIQVNSRRSILKALRDRTDLKVQLKRNKIKFGGQREKGLTETVRLYNKLS